MEIKKKTVGKREYDGGGSFSFELKREKRGLTLTSTPLL